jgi:hypothetical protein
MSRDSIVGIRDCIDLAKFTRVKSVEKCHASCMVRSMKTARQIASLIKDEVTAILNSTSSEVVFDPSEEDGIVRGYV